MKLLNNWTKNLLVGTNGKSKKKKNDLKRMVKLEGGWGWV